MAGLFKTEVERLRRTLSAELVQRGEEVDLLALLRHLTLLVVEVSEQEHGVGSVGASGIANQEIFQATNGCVSQSHFLRPKLGQRTPVSLQEEIPFLLFSRLNDAPRLIIEFAHPADKAGHCAIESQQFLLFKRSGSGLLKIFFRDTLNLCSFG